MKSVTLGKFTSSSDQGAAPLGEEIAPTLTFVNDEFIPSGIDNMEGMHAGKNPNILVINFARAHWPNFQDDVGNGPIVARGVRLEKFPSDLISRVPAVVVVGR